MAHRRDLTDDNGLPPGEFEEIDLTTPGAPEEGAEAASVGARTDADTGALLSAHARLERQLLIDVADQAMSAASGTAGYGFENIVGVGIGERISGGKETGELGVRVYVIHKAGPDEVEASALIPSTIDGIATDVIAIGEIHAQPFRGRYRPAPGGVSVGHYKITAGTIACLVRRGNQLFILSNNHVLANQNNAKVGDPILQPGPYDGGKFPADVIAKLSAFVPISFGGSSPNLVDCAIAQTSPSVVSPKNIAYGKIGAPPVPCHLNMLVRKAGRTTQFTRGRIVDCSATVRVGYGTSGPALFRNQIIIQSVTQSPFSQGGDSGSLIVAEDPLKAPVGLLFAGSVSHTIANPILAVLQALGVSIVT